MSLVAEDIIEVVRVMFDGCFDILRDLRNNDISEAFVGYIWVYIYDDRMKFLKRFSFYFLDEANFASK
jgi:hypothetical protein